MKRTMISRFRFWIAANLGWRFHRAMAWVLWLPHRKLRASLFNEFREWGTPLATLKAMSKRLADTDERLKHAHAEWDKADARARSAEIRLLSGQITQEQRDLITGSFAIDLSTNRN